MFARAFLSFFVLSTVSMTLAVELASQINSRASNCSSVEVRKEWRNLSSTEQTAYLEAEICLMNLPAQTGLAAVTSRYSDLASLHQNLTLIIHEVGQFLPWHRYFVHVHQGLLASQCGYTGPIP